MICASCDTDAPPGVVVRVNFLVHAVGAAGTPCWRVDIRLCDGCHVYRAREMREVDTQSPVHVAMCPACFPLPPEERARIVLQHTADAVPDPLRLYPHQEPLARELDRRHP